MFENTALDPTRKIVIVDSEFTSWEGALQRNWSGPNEYKEVVQIAAVKLDPAQDYAEIDRFDILVKPTLNPVLSDYFKDLTAISQAEVDEKGVAFVQAMNAFYDFIEHGGCQVWSYGREDFIFEENCAYYNLTPVFTEPFNNFRDLVKAMGDNPDLYSSGTVYQAVGIDLSGHVHNALHDARSQAEYLRFYHQKHKS